MKAVFLPGNKRVEIRAVEVPKPRQDEVLVQVKASCICRSDLSLYYGNAVVGGDAAGRCITGHEPAGIIVEVGSAVRQFKKDDRVAIHLAVGCGVCAYCRAGHFHLCAEWACLGFTADGGNAEYIAVPERNLLRRSDHWPFIQAGIPATGFVFGYRPGTESEARYRHWYQVQYHHPQDDPSQPMDWTAAGKFNRFFYALVAAVADADQAPQWKTGSSLAPRAATP